MFSADSSELEGKQVPNFIKIKANNIDYASFILSNKRLSCFRNIRFLVGIQYLMSIKILITF